MGIRLDELKAGGYIIRESVTETLIGECHTFAGYVQHMQNALLDPTDGVEKEDFEMFTTEDDKRLIKLFFDTCDECGERLIDCLCKKNLSNREWFSSHYPYLIE